MINLENLCRHFEVGNQVVRALDEVDLAINEKEYAVSYTHLRAHET